MSAHIGPTIKAPTVAEMAKQSGADLPPLLCASQWTGAWNDWIAPFHRCPRCGESLHWLQCGTVYTARFISATCCGIHFNASLR